MSALTGSQAPWVQLHPSRSGCVSLSKPCPSRGLLGTRGSRDSARQVPGTEPRPCLPRPWAGGGRRSGQLAPGREAAGAAGEVSGEARDDLGASCPPDLGSAFLMGANLPSEVATIGRTGSTNPGTAPGQHSGLASASHLGLASSLGNEAEASPTCFPLPSAVGRREGTREGGGASSRRVDTWTRVPSAHSTLPAAHTCRPAAATPLPPAHTGPSTRAKPHTRLHTRVSGPLSATLGTTAPQSGSSEPRPGRVTVTNVGVSGPGEAEASRPLPASSPTHSHMGLTARTWGR